jgi:hypothetical protein
VEGYVAAARNPNHRYSTFLQQLRRSENVGGIGIAPEGNDRRVLDEQQRLGNCALDDTFPNLLLER